MPYLNMKEVKAEVALCLAQDTIDTAHSNMAMFTKCKVEEAKAAREAQGLLGHATDCNFLGMVCSNMILNCTMTANAIKNANLIFGPDLAGIRGQTVRTLPADYVQILRHILESHVGGRLYVCERNTILG
jgi:hypothetical protein